MNAFKKKETEEVKPKEAVFKAPGKVVRGVASVLNGSFLTREMVVKQLPFILFLVVIAMMYIANSYYAEKTVREINITSNELKELKSEYITTKSDLMHVSKQSQVAQLALPQGIKESTIPPKKITIKKNQKKEAER